MKVERATLVGTGFSGYIHSIRKALERSGIPTETIVFPNYRNGWRSISRRIGSDFIPDFYRRRIMRKVEASAGRSDCIFLLRGDLLGPADIRSLRQRCGVPVVLWLIDALRMVKAGPALCAESDAVICFNREDQETLAAESVKARFMPLAFDADDYRPIPGAEHDMDLFFVGTLHPERVLLLDALLGKLQPLGINIAVYGPLYGWYRSYRRFRFLKERPHFMRHLRNTRLSHSAINMMTNRSKINLNIFPRTSTSAANIRTYEICGAGGFQLVTRNNILNDLFLDGEEVVGYSGLEELHDRVLYYLDEKNAEERTAIAARGRRKAQRLYSFDVRVREVVDFISQSL